MLILSRYTHEQIRIGDDIIISVQRINGGQVKIGISAPKDIIVLRDELIKRDSFSPPASLDDEKSI